MIDDVNFEAQSATVPWRILVAADLTLCATRGTDRAGPGRAYFLNRPDPGRAESGLVLLQARSGSGQVGPAKKAGPIGPGFGPSPVSAEKMSKFEFFCREKSDKSFVFKIKKTEEGKKSEYYFLGKKVLKKKETEKKCQKNKAFT